MGKKESEGEYICLNVGKAQNIGTEIIYDLGCFYYISFRENGSQSYINQFDEDCGFKYESGQTQEFLYLFIKKNYCSIKFVYVHDDNSADFEKRYAKDKHARFWRNGGSFEIKKTTNYGRKDI